MTPFRKKSKSIFSELQTKQLVNAIREAESKTSGEIRVYVERHCKYVDAIDRAAHIFHALEMRKTKRRNGVLFYVATDDRQIAVFADEGIHKAMGGPFWNDVIHRIISDIKSQTLINSLSNAIEEVGAALANHFPFDKTTDKNELPDDIIFGK